MLYTDRPGIVAIYGAEVRRRQHQHRRHADRPQSAGGQALSVLTVDSPVPDGLLDEVREAIQADLFRQIEITES